MAQDGPEMAPRWPEDRPKTPKMAPGGPKMAPKWPQDGPKMAPNAYHEAPLTTFLLSRAGGMRGAIEFGRSPALAWAPCQNSFGKFVGHSLSVLVPKCQAFLSMTPAHSAGPKSPCYPRDPVEPQVDVKM